MNILHFVSCLLISSKSCEEVASVLKKTLLSKARQLKNWNKISNWLSYLESYEEAIYAWKESLSYEPNQIQLWLKVGYSLDYLGLSEEASHTFVEASWLLLDLEQYKEVVGYCDKAISLYKSNYDAFYLKGQALVELELYNEAVLSLDKAIKIGTDSHKIWCNSNYIIVKCVKTIAKFGSIEQVITCLNKAIENSHKFLEAWYEKSEILFSWAKILLDSGKDKDAIIKLEEALKINPDCYKAWNCQGLINKNLENWKDSLNDFDRAIEINPDYDEAWISRNEVILKLLELGHYSSVIASCEVATKIKFDHPESWYFWGSALSQLKNYSEALKRYDKAIEFKNDYPEAWYEKGQALLHSESYTEAIHCYDQALEFSPDYYLAWNGKGNALKSLGNELGYREHCEEAIDNFGVALEITNNHYWRSWRNMGLARQYLNQYRAALQSWNNGLKYIQQDDEDYQEGCGLINHSKAKYQYKQGRNTRNYSYLLEAKKSYEEALKYYTETEFPNKHLNVLEELVSVIEILITAFRGIGTTDTVERLLAEGTELLDRLLDKVPEHKHQKKIEIEQRFVSFRQLNIDNLAQSSEEEKNIKALEKAEERKNLCLRWLRKNKWIKKDLSSPNYFAIKKLLSPNTSAIYWHISPAAITVFVIQPQQMYPDVISAPEQLKAFQEWMKQWKQDYKDYRGVKRKTRIEPETHTWRELLQRRLVELAEILNTTTIISHLHEEIKQLILIPHRDLQLLPLHYLFQQKKDFNITYLPSAKIGCRLKESIAHSDQQMLIVENFYTETLTKVINKDKKTGKWHLSKIPRRSDSLPFPQIESSIISQLYQPNCNCISGVEATEFKVKKALNKVGSFIFTGHGYHSLRNPQISALSLSRGGRLTLEDILQLDLHNYYLVCLSACESGITSSDFLMDDYVGLVSGFLAAGTAYVISTLWTVDDTSSALLMMEFHRLLKEEYQIPASALKKAQNWLRNLTYKDLALHYRQLADKLPTLSRQARQCKQFLKAEAERVIHPDNIKLNRHKHPYSNPYYWSGFTLTGKVDS